MMVLVASNSTQRNRSRSRPSNPDHDSYEEGEMVNNSADPPMKHPPTTLHDLLVAWQRGALTARQAMAMSGIDTVAELYGAARSSAVPIRKALLARERSAADAATSAIRERLAARETAGAGR